MSEFLYLINLLRYLLLIHKICKVSFRDLFETFILVNEYPILKSIKDNFRIHAEEIIGANLSLSHKGGLIFIGHLENLNLLDWLRTKH